MQDTTAGPSGTSDAYAGESSGGEDGAKGLKEWWARFKVGNKGGGASSSSSSAPAAAHSSWGKGKEVLDESKGKPVFAMPLSEAITYASITISTPGPNGDFFVWGVVPTVVARCGRYLKEKATEVEGTFRVSGSSKRMKDIQALFDSPPKYGKYIDWDAVPHTTHDVATIFRRFLTQMPEPVIPDSFYREFRSIYTQEPFDAKALVEQYIALINKLPVPNKYLLLYVLDLLSVFEKKSDKNLMTATNLATIFQPGILSHPDHHMIPAAHTLNQKIVEFLVSHVDDFAPLLESRLKENPYRRKTSKTRKADPAKAAATSSSRLPFSQPPPVRPAMPQPRATRLSDTFAASESDDDDDFPGAVIVKVNDPKLTQQTLLNRSKSTASSNKSPRGSRRSSGKGSVLDDLSLTPTSEPVSPGNAAQASVRRRATAPTRRSVTDGSNPRRRPAKDSGALPTPKEVEAV